MQTIKSNYKEKSYITILFAFITALSLFRIYYILNCPFDLSPDEAHYWEWSRRLDLSYYSKGPLIAYLIYIGTALFGDTVFGVRFFAVVFSFLSSFFLFLIGKELYDTKTGVIAGIIFQIIPLFSVYGVLFTIDSPFIFFWILSLFLFLKSLNSCTASDKSVNITLWILLGISIGIGLLAKYSMAFFYICAFLYMILNKEKRELLFTKEPYISFLISILLFSPVILWNAKNNWVTLRHTAGQAHAYDGLQFQFKDLIEFIGSQFGVITPLLLIIIFYSLFLFRKKEQGNFLFWFSIPILVFFVLKSIQGKVQGNWPMPGYITGLIAFSKFSVEQFFYRKSWLKITIVLAILISFTITAFAHYPFLLNLPPKNDPSVRLYGWNALGKKVSELYKELPGPVFIFSDKYQISSELAFYVEGKPFTYCINIDRRMNQYDIWPDFHNFIHYNAIFVRSGDVSIPDDVRKAFGKVEKNLFTIYTKNRDRIKDFSIFICYDFKGMKERKPDTY